jgi:UPF0716 family protein affecting phage T7 exclusion
MPYFLLYLFIETLVSVAIASNIGGLLTFVEIILSAAAGIFIIANFNHSVRDNIEAVAKGHISAHEFQRMNIASMVGAILLIVPGFFTDILGLLLQFEKISTLVATKFLKLKNKEKEDYYDPFTKKGEDDVIDVEVIDASDSSRR